MSTLGPAPHGGGEGGSRDGRAEGERFERLVVPRRRLGGPGRPQGLLAAAAILGVVGVGLAIARLDDRASGSVGPGASVRPGASATLSVEGAAMSPFRTPRPTPAVTPASPCLAISDDRAPTVVLVAPGHAGIAGQRTYDRWTAAFVSPEPAGPVPSVEVPSGSPIDLEVVGGGCARAWDIALTTGDAMGVRSIAELQTNPTMDPLVAAQNRFRLRLTGSDASWDVAATLSFADGTVDYRWIVGLAGPPP